MRLSANGLAGKPSGGNSRIESARFVRRQRRSCCLSVRLHRYRFGDRIDERMVAACVCDAATQPIRIRAQRRDAAIHRRPPGDMSATLARKFPAPQRRRPRQPPSQGRLPRLKEVRRSTEALAQARDLGALAGPRGRARFVATRRAIRTSHRFPRWLSVVDRRRS